jgi:hypothetical protein
MRRALQTVSAATLLLLLLLPTAPASGSYQLVTKWGKYGTADDRFKNPTGLATGPQDKIYVADVGNVRVKKFDASGTFISSKWGATASWSTRGESPPTPSAMSTSPTCSPTGSRSSTRRAA